MKTIGLIGGMSWESTVEYYRILNTTVKEKLGGLHSSRCILYSVDFAPLEKCLSAQDWDKIAEILTDAAQSLERAGADFIVICTNTMHKVVPQIQSGISIPILHIAEATADELIRHSVKKAALLGTAFTMEQDFYTKKLEEKGITVIITEKDDRVLINRVIFEELCLGIVSPSSKRQYLDIINRLAAEGADGIILGCTEIGMLVKQSDTSVPLFDTTVIHATDAAMRALAD